MIYKERNHKTSLIEQNALQAIKIFFKDFNWSSVWIRGSRVSQQKNLPISERICQVWKKRQIMHNRKDGYTWVWQIKASQAFAVLLTCCAADAVLATPPHVYYIHYVRGLYHVCPGSQDVPIKTLEKFPVCGFRWEKSQNKGKSLYFVYLYRYGLSFLQKFC